MNKNWKFLIAISAVLFLFLVTGCDSLSDPGAESGTYTVTFDSNGGSAVTALTVEGGHTATKPTDPTKIVYTFDRGNTANAVETRYVFIGWYSDSDLTQRFDFATKISEDITLYAKWRPIAKPKIRISSTDYEKTEEIYAIDSDKRDDDNITTIEGNTPSFITGNANAMDKGVFWSGRTVELSPFIMSRYEVTQELYSAVMDGNTFTNQSAGASNYAVVKESNGTTDAAGGAAYKIDKTPSICIVAPSDPVYPLPTGETANKRPVDNVTWYDAVYFCNKLSAAQNLTAAYTITGITITLNENSTDTGHITSATVALVADANGYRLPTEAEWEFAARGGDPAIASWSYMFSGSDTASGKTHSDDINSGLDATGWYAFNTSTANGTTALQIPSETTRTIWGSHEVGKKGYNELGLYDMSGNVAEWCYDVPLYSVDRDPAGASTSNQRVVRGGSWFADASDCVVSHRALETPGMHGADIGFRVVRSIPED